MPTEQELKDEIARLQKLKADKLQLFELAQQKKQLEEETESVRHPYQYILKKFLFKPIKDLSVGFGKLGYNALDKATRLSPEEVEMMKLREGRLLAQHREVENLRRQRMGLPPLQGPLMPQQPVGQEKKNHTSRYQPTVEYRRAPPQPKHPKRPQDQNQA